MTLPIAETWYAQRNVSDGIDLIYEPHVSDFVRCNMWLVRGRSFDILIDSGMGLRPLKQAVAALRERPVKAVCSHCHFDHIGALHEFDERIGHHAEADIFANPTNPATCADKWIKGELLTALPHEGYRLETYSIKPAPLTGYLDEGDVLDLGDRTFQIFHMPGHSPGSIGLFDRKARVLFSGDIIYDGPLIDTAWHSNAAIYEHSLRRLLDLPVDVIHGGHGESFGRERLKELVNAYLAGGQRIEDVDAYVRSIGKAA